MTAPAGWYDAGDPNRQRWWDGTQWTEHERDFSVAQAVDPGFAAQRVPMGWYTVPGSDTVRWHDGRNWTPYRIVNGEPKANWYATEPPLIGYLFALLFLSLAGAQAGLASLSGNWGSATLMLLLGVFWLTTGIAGSMVRRASAPVTPAVAPETAVPLPGQEEGPGAGWYPVSPRINRWWSGTRWASYVSEANRVRPTFGGPRAFRLTRILALVLLGVGVLGLIIGAVLLVSIPHRTSLLGIAVLIVGAVLALVGAIVYPVIGMRRAALLLPERPPAQLR